MHLSLIDLSLLGLFLSSVTAVPTARNNDKSHGKGKDTTYAECQRPKEQGKQLQGCPEGTVYVSQTDPQANYGSVSPFSPFCRVELMASRRSKAPS